MVIRCIPDFGVNMLYTANMAETGENIVSKQKKRNQTRERVSNNWRTANRAGANGPDQSLEVTKNKAKNKEDRKHIKNES